MSITQHQAIAAMASLKLLISVYLTSFVFVGPSATNRMKFVFLSISLFWSFLVTQGIQSVHLTAFRIFLGLLAFWCPFAVAARLLYILPPVHPVPPPPYVGGPTHLMIVLGSGGHTAEMLAMLERINSDVYNHRTYVVTSGDQLSVDRARGFEACLRPGRKPCDWPPRTVRDESPLPGVPSGTYDIFLAPRPRKIHQPLWKAAWSTLNCFLASICALRRLDSPSILEKSPWEKPSSVIDLFLTQPSYPDLIMVNGPGIAVCVVFASLFLRFWSFNDGYYKMRTIYVESFARVHTLSLSGRILLHCVNRFFVQWSTLARVNRRVEYMGILVI